MKKDVHTAYHDFLDRWDYKEADKLAPHRGTHDHAINLTPGAQAQPKAYMSSSRDYNEVVSAYCDEIEVKGFIRRSKSSWAAPVIVVKKPRGGLQVCVDYRALNSLTI